MTFFRKNFRFSVSFPRFSVSFAMLNVVYVYDLISFAMLNVVYDLTITTAISQKKSLMTPFFTLFVLSRASDNTTSQNIKGTDAWAVPPHLQFFWRDRAPSPPRSPPLATGKHKYREANSRGGRQTGGWHAMSCYAWNLIVRKRGTRYNYASGYVGLHCFVIIRYVFV